MNACQKKTTMAVLLAYVNQTLHMQNFIGNSYLNPLTDPKKTVFMANITFEPACRNNRHIQHAEKSGDNRLIARLLHLISLI